MVGFGQFGIYAHIRGSGILLLDDFCHAMGSAICRADLLIECHKLLDVTFFLYSLAAGVLGCASSSLSSLPCGFLAFHFSSMYKSKFYYDILDLSSLWLVLFEFFLALA